MSEDWQPIERFTDEWLGEVPDLEVRSADGRVARAAKDPDYGWMDLTDPENPVELGWEPVEWRVV